MDLSVIGARIERELGQVADNSLLGKWMAHRVAELMARADAASGDAKAACEAELQALILELWQMRAALPGNVDPEKRLKRAIAVLERLDEDRSYFAPRSRGDDPVAVVGATAYREIATLNAQVTSLQMAEDFDQYCSDEANLPLDADMIDIREKLEAMLADFVAGRIFVTTAKEAKDPSSIRTLLRKKMAGTIDELIASLRRMQEAVDPLTKPAHTRKAKKPSDPFRREGFRKI